MMHEYRLTFTLLSDTTFGRGEGIAGLIDREVEHDRYGLPYLRGRTLKGLITEETDNVLFALGRAGVDVGHWDAVRRVLYGRGGSRAADRGKLRFGPAELPVAVRDAVRAVGNTPKLAAANRLPVLESLTAVRRQTAIENDGDNYGVPAEGSLRAMRVVLRETPFEARLWGDRKLEPDELALLAASLLAFRRAGTGRNRGRGKLAASLTDTDGNSILETNYRHFIDTALGQNTQQEVGS